MNSHREPRPWRIGVLSTAYDLLVERRTVIRRLQALGFQAVAFEDPVTFPGSGETDVHSHEACALTAETLDMAVLIIGARSGGPYLSVGPHSVTEEEYRRVLANGRPVLVFVHQGVWDERHRAFKLVSRLMRNGVATVEDARSQVRLRSLKPAVGLGGRSWPIAWESLDFLDRVRRQSVNQWISQFHTPDELADLVEARLRMMSKRVLQDIVQAQLAYVGRMRATSGAFASIRELREMGCLVDTRYTCPGKPRPGAGIMRVLATLRSENTRLLISGSPGAGKTTLLSAAFVEHAAEALAEKRSRLPFFVSLRGVGADYHLSTDRYLSECCVEFLNREPFPLLDASIIEPVYYIDGLDEARRPPDYADLERAAASEMLRTACALSIRSAAMDGPADSSREFGSLFQEHLRLSPWTSKESQLFATRYLRAAGVSRELRGSLILQLRDLPSDSPIRTNPLCLSLALWTLRHGAAKELPVSELAVLARFIDQLARRELERTGLAGDESSVQQLVRVWSVAAWHIYENRALGQTVTLAALRRFVKREVRGVAGLVDSVAFVGILSLTPNEDGVSGMLHDEILHYLVAVWFAKAIASRHESALKYLAHQGLYPVNHYLKQLWSLPASREQLPDTLSSLVRAFKGAGRDSRDDINRRVNAVYYISRLPIAPESARALRSLRAAATDLYTMNGVLFGLMRLGDAEAEAALYDSLLHDPLANSINRGLHLVYFTDWSPRPDEDPPYQDDGRRDWSRAMQGLLAHLENPSSRFLHSRRIDVLTIRSYMDHRNGTGPFGTTEISRLRRVLKSSRDALGAEGYEALETEMLQLFRRYESLSVK